MTEDETFLWQMSFTDPAIAATIPEDEQRPGGPSYLGGCCVEGRDEAEALTRSHEKGCNPGGQVMIVGPMPVSWIGPEWRDRLLTMGEVLAIPEPAELRDKGEPEPERFADVDLGDGFTSRLRLPGV